MKIAILGSGAVGCLFAAHLARDRRNEIWLLGRDPGRAKDLSRRGITVVGHSRMRIPGRRINVTVDARRAGLCDAVLVCVKAYDTAGAARQVLPCVGAGTLVVTFQNGYGNVGAIRRILPRRSFSNVIGGITSHGVTLLGVGKVRHAGAGETVMGFDGRSPASPVRALARLLTRSGIRTSLYRGTDSLIWSKVVINSGINPLAALLGVPNGGLVKNAWLKRLLCAIVAESARVVRASGVRLRYANPCARAVAVCNMTAVNINSMLEDMRRRRRTEVEAINGAIVREGRRRGIPAPLNRACMSLVITLEKR